MVKRIPNALLAVVSISLLSILVRDEKHIHATDKESRLQKRSKLQFRF